MTDGISQGFTKPNRNASSWDSDINANFTQLEKGYFVPAVCAANTAVFTGQLVTFNASGLAQAYNPIGNSLFRPSGIALETTSPGNTGYFLVRGALQQFTPWSGQLARQGNTARFFASIRTPGWVTTSANESANIVIGHVLADGTYSISMRETPPSVSGQTSSGQAHAASGALGVFSFSMFVGAYGLNHVLRVKATSCDNFRATFYADSARTSIIYDTTVLSGNIGVRTYDMIDAAMWPFSLNISSSVLAGIIHGAVQVLSSAVTAINSDSFSCYFEHARYR